MFQKTRSLMNLLAVCLVQMKSLVRPPCRICYQPKLLVHCPTNKSLFGYTYTQKQSSFGPMCFIWTRQTASRFIRLRVFWNIGQRECQRQGKIRRKNSGQIWNIFILL
jgi:hypothetical protein